tara:strand:+ start:1413 stop:2285 length:873 start_codon:yes stop_codon:yes gene_type:complete
MDNKFSKSWIKMRMDYDNISRSSVLVDYLNLIPKENDIDLIDLYCGSGNFLIWSFNKNILFKNCILVDNDINLLKSIKSNLRAHSASAYSIRSNTNNLDLLIKKNSETISLLSIKKNNCDDYRYSSKKNHVISYSAALDIMSKSSIHSALKRIKKNNVLYFSLCFNGLVRWTPTNTFDKYILTFFNNHQRSDKGFGKALGHKSIEFIRKKAEKLNLKIVVEDSPWIVKNKSYKDKVFMKRYLLDIKKSLFHMEGIDRDILREWYQEKKSYIDNKNIKLYVGHNDILLYKK